jgi:hypothetical protein
MKIFAVILVVMGLLLTWGAEVSAQEKMGKKQFSGLLKTSNGYR